MAHTRRQQPSRPRRARRPAPSASPEAPRDEGLAFLKLLWQLDHGLRSLSKRMENTLGVTGPQRFALRMLGAVGAQSAGALADLLALHPSTLTGILDRLTRGGLIARLADPRDARRAVLTLTAAGERVDRRQAGSIEAAVRAALSQSGERELAGARNVLERIVRALEDAI